MTTQSMTKRRLAKVGAALVASLAAAIAGLGALPAQGAPAGGGDSAINGYRNVGYFAQWGVYGRNFQVKDLDTNGAAAQLTHINYAFGNIHNSTLKCFEATKASQEGFPEGAGDAYADYGKTYAAGASVSGAADAWDQPLAGNFNQLKQLKAKHPQLKVMLSIGGWTYSKYFSKAAATPATRQAFVSSCIDMFIKGNLPVIDGFGGPGAAAGVFDGIDIDWEWPGSLNGESHNYVDQANDRANFKALLAEFRSQLDAYGATNGKKYLLSAFLPANTSDIAAGGWNDPAIFNSLDFGNIQGYDFWGTWDTSRVGHQANLYDDPADPRAADKRYSVDKAVKAYTNAGIPAKQLGIGLAAYGRGWSNVSSSTPWASGSFGAAQGTYQAGFEDYYVLKNKGTDYYDANIGAAWRYNAADHTWWSYDNAQTIAQKGQYIASKGLGGGMWWELDGDRNNDLVKVLNSTLKNATAGPVGNSGNNGGGGNNGGDPGGDGGNNGGGGDPGGDGGNNGGGGDNGGTCSAPAWSAGSVYTGGQQVSHNGQIWTAGWWTQGETPGTTGEWGVWSASGTCSGGGGNNGGGGNDGGNNGGGNTGGGGLPIGTGTIVASNGMCVDVPWADTTNGNPIQIVWCNSGAAQQWARGADGTVRSLGKCLDVNGSGTANGTKVQLWDCNGTNAQKWTYDAGAKSLRNPQSNKCLDVPSSQFNEGQKLQIWDCNNTGAQKWTL